LAFAYIQIETGPRVAGRIILDHSGNAMLDFITKADYFHWMEIMQLPRRGNIKDVQDGFVMAQLQGAKGLKVLEMGGGDSRLLRLLAPDNECWNVEKFQGVDGGPGKEVVIPGVRNLHAFMGDFSSELPNEYFDVALSISVIEHIPDEGVLRAFQDISRVLKPGGTAVHAIDMYLMTAAHEHQVNNERRMRLYLSIAEACGLRLRQAAAAPLSPRFDSAYASNSDLAMFYWNSVAPSLKSLREVAQGCSLKCIWEKPAR
jgi:SAM-dependent methyltransferase